MTFIICLENTTVYRENVAEVMIFGNQSRFSYKENVGMQTLWPGMLNIHNFTIIKVEVAWCIAIICVINS